MVLLSGDVTTDYLQKIVDFDKNQISLARENEASTAASGISVSIDTLSQAIEYLQTAEGNSSSFSAAV